MKCIYLVIGLFILAGCQQANPPGATPVPAPLISASVPLIGFGKVVVGTTSAPKSTVISVATPGTTGSPGIKWTRHNLLGAGRFEFLLVPDPLGPRPLLPSNPAEAKFRASPQRLGQHTATFQPDFTGAFTLDASPLVTLKCEGVGRIADTAADTVKMTNGFGTNPIDFGALSVTSGASSRKYIRVTNTNAFDIEIKTAIKYLIGRTEIVLMRAFTEASPGRVAARRAGNVELLFAPTQIGLHEATVEVSWRRVGSSAQWVDKHFYAHGTGVE